MKEVCKELDKDMSRLVGKLNELQGMTNNENLKKELGEIKVFLSNKYRYSYYDTMPFEQAVINAKGVQDE